MLPSGNITDTYFYLNMWIEFIFLNELKTLGELAR